MGAVVIEKHFTDDNLREGPDHSFAMNPVTWEKMVTSLFDIITLSNFEEMWLKIIDLSFNFVYFLERLFISWYAETCCKF